MINATMMTVNPFGENLYILWDEASRDAVVVDPGMMREAERKMVTDFIDGQKLDVKHILLTHLHVDHITSARWLADLTGADVCGSTLDAQLGLELPDQVAHFHINIQVEPLTIDRDLADGDTIFNGSVGRTDLWGGDMAQLISSIREKVLPLPDETVIASGHGPTTTVADEKRCNPFL